MGTSNSKPKICKVTPKEEPSFCQAAPPRMVTAAQRLPQHQQGILGHRQIGQLPPLKQHAPQIVSSPPVHSECVVNCLADFEPVHSIIKSHPPQRAKAWQPIACPIKPRAVSKASDEPVSTGGRCGAGNSRQRNQGGLLQAQTFLIGQATKRRQSHQRHRREQRRIYTSGVEEVGNAQIERIRLVSRPTQRDIFWDEAKGQNLDLRELLQPSPPLTDSDSEMEEMTRQPKSEVRLTGNWSVFSRDVNESVTKSPERITQQKLPWLEDFRKHEKKHLNSRDLLEGRWGCKQWLDERNTDMERNTIGQENSVDQKWNSWGQTHIS